MGGPMESAPYGPPRVDPSLLRHIPLFSASVMLGEKTLEEGSGIRTPQRDACEETVEIDMSSPPVAGRSTPELPMRHVWTKKPRGQQLAEMVQVEER